MICKSLADFHLADFYLQNIIKLNIIHLGKRNCPYFIVFYAIAGLWSGGHYVIPLENFGAGFVYYLCVQGRGCSLVLKNKHCKWKVLDIICDIPDFSKEIFFQARKNSLLTSWTAFDFSTRQGCEHSVVVIPPPVSTCGLCGKRTISINAICFRAAPVLEASHRNWFFLASFFSLCAAQHWTRLL